MQLVESLLLEEGHDAVLLLNDHGRHVGDQGFNANVDNLFLGLWLKPKVGIFFFTENGTICLEQVLIAITCCIPIRGIVLKFDPTVVQERRLKLCNVVVQVRCALPEEAPIASDRLLLAFLTKVDVDTDGSFESITIDHLLVAIVGDLVLNRALELGLQTDDYTIFKLELALLAQRVQKVALHVVDVQIIKQSVQQHCEDGVVVPLLDQLKQEVLADLANETWLNAVVEVGLDDAFVHLVHLLASIMGVALLVDGRAAVLEHFRVRDRCLLIAQEGSKRTDVIVIDVVLALRETHHVNVVVHANTLSVLLVLKSFLNQK